jgi:DNA polymerase II small subunit
MDNVRMVGNPTVVRLSGVTFLIYHGRSLDDIIATIPELSYARPAAAMQILLKTRHLAPIYGKRTALSPEERDMLVIDTVPDVFHSGHVHTIDTLEYRGTLVVNSGTWQSQTPFQANMGLDPTPSIFPILDLSTLGVVKRSMRYDFSSAS